MGSLLTLREFTSVAATAVEAAGAAPANGQAKAVPAERMVRYYTARGLLPRPGTRGRSLVYGRRHVLCLVAVKRLQGQGLSLDEVGARLEGLTSTELEQLAAIPAGIIPADLDEVTSAPGPARRSTRFWANPGGPVAHSGMAGLEVRPDRPYFPDASDSGGYGPAAASAAPTTATAPAAAPAAPAPGPAQAAPAPDAAPTTPAPAAASATPPSPAQPAPADAPAAAPAQPAPPSPDEVQATPLLALRLSDTVTLLVENAGASIPPLSQVQAAAQPLLDLLSRATSAASTPPGPAGSRPSSAPSPPPSTPSRPASGAARPRKDLS
jgi:hypothetical protein